MGAIGEAFAAYAQPLLDQTDGSEEQAKKAFALSQFCFNVALVPEGSRESAISELKLSLGMDDEDFDEFRRSIVDPIIQRHEEMFPLMHGRGSTDSSQSRPSPRGPTFRTRPGIAARREAYRSMAVRMARSGWRCITLAGSLR